MNTLSIVAMAVAGMACLWVLSIFIIKPYADHMSSPRTEKFVAQNRLLRVPQSVNSGTHDVLAYSLGYS